MKQSVGVCVIGAGRAGLVHANNFKRNIPNARLVALADPREELAQQYKEEMDIDYYTDYREALEDERVDAVIVVTPTVYHKEIVVAAARAGKHVLCEKPMAMNEDECDEMIKACKDANVKLQIGFMRRFDESFVQAKRCIDEGMIGNIVLVKSLTRGPSVPQPWMYDLSRSNGPLAEVNSHDIDTLRWLAGAEIASVYAIAGNYRCRDIALDYPDFYDNVVLTASFEDGKQGVIDGAVSVQYGYDSRVEVLGTEGVISIGQQRGHSFVVAGKNKQMQQPFMNSWRSLYKDAYLAEDHHFIQCILHDQEPIVSGLDGKMAVRVVEVGNLSIREKKVINMSSQ